MKSQGGTEHKLQLAFRLGVLTARNREGNGVGLGWACLDYTGFSPSQNPIGMYTCSDYVASLFERKR